MSKTDDDRPLTPAEARARRLAEALRANLRRRKAQLRARAAEDGAAPDAADAGGPPDDAPPQDGH
ncbi:hypothetical protein [Oceanicella actignis]|uniref:hypothetical protein n=1 Tax=Oceanicella actignis TaxID=1189325 RepID=UPI0011E75820|nr:hypothetical protein [Oceanicella actignis]TYO90010.1 hypothetical protein LY05_01207 [Oceanicella actignis]